MNTEKYIEYMAKFGMITKDEIKADNKRHYIHVFGDKPNNKTGWYVIFSNGCGSFGSFRLGIKEKFRVKTTRTNFDIRREKVSEKKAEERLSVARSRAREMAKRTWKLSDPAKNYFAYLLRTGVESYGLRFYRGKLIIPIFDENDVLHSLQTIDQEGNKRFLQGGRKTGCFFIIGEPKKIIYIAEGYATAASVHAVTKKAVVVAFDAGNLKPVAEAIRRKYPHIEIIICADNDYNTPGNPGMSKAFPAAAVVGGRVVYMEELSQ